MLFSSDFFITSDAKIALNDQSFDKVIENKNVKGLKIIIKKAVGVNENKTSIIKKSNLEIKNLFSKVGIFLIS